MRISTTTTTLFKTRNMVLIALMAAIICILAPMSVPLGFTPVPITLGLFAIFLTAYVLPPTQATVCYLVYLLLGMVGLPVFSGYSSGLSRIVGPTGGYLVGFIATMWISSYFIHKHPQKIWVHVMAMVVGVLACYTLGTIWFSAQKGIGLVEAIFLCVVPFMIGDAIKIAVATVVGREIVKRVEKI